MNDYSFLFMIELLLNNLSLMKCFLKSSIVFFIYFGVVSAIIAVPRPKPLVYIGEDGHLHYISDKLGNRVIDFSYCGYGSSEKTIPTIPAKVLVPIIHEDATELIQRAIDHVSSLPLNENGFRGAIQFEAGEYSVKGRLVINKSGIVLRGKGMSPNGTKLIVKGKSRDAFIKVLGEENKKLGEVLNILDAYVPVNAKYITVGHAKEFALGQQIMIHRPSTKKWLATLDMDEMGGEETGYLGWKEGQRDIWWDRTISAIKGDTIFFKVPLTTALDTTYGISQVVPYQWEGRINHIGIENMALSSDFDVSNPKDEDHCHTAISVENAENIWVRQIEFSHFSGSAVAVYETARKVTVQDCMSLSPVSEIGAWRRNTFFTMGQQTLFQRLYAEEGYHDFATGFCATGPNAFVECYSNQPYSYSGSIDSWASGLLFDIVHVDGHKLSFSNHYIDDQGAGWCAANSMFWQCSATRIENFSPPTATNWCFASWGQFVGNGYWHEQNSHLSPRSLYYKQLADRLGKDESEFENQYKKKPDGATSSPKVADAIALSKKAFKPLESMKQWMQKAPERYPISTKVDGAILATKLKEPKSKNVDKAPQIAIKNGWIVKGNIVLSGTRPTVPWWRGVARPYQAIKESPAITRYVPGRYGKGYTDNLSEVIDWMKDNNAIGMEHNYGLWYDRRRMDHERIRRMDGNVWAPFYVQPFARSGKGIAWDGLSKYDLTKYDYFYWSRLKEFANLADANGRILVHHNYFQHNILEAGAHWADSPWRPMNNINDTGFPDPPPYAGDKRIFIAEQFYDINNPIRRELHKKFIRKCLNNFADNHGVLQLISAEYTGPLEFVEFWLDVIKEWQEKTGKNAMVGLSTTKDVQDAILNQPERAAIVDVIDVRYWSYRPDSTCYQPKGGVQLAPRQHARLEKTGSRSFNSVYRNVIEYKKRFPEKAVIFSEGRYDAYGWAVFMAGGSLPVLSIEVSKDLMAAASTMQPIGDFKNPNELSRLGNDKGESIIYLGGKHSVQLDLTPYKGSFLLQHVDVKTGTVHSKTRKIKAGELVVLSNDSEREQILWISR